jgi:hypothetical protein
MNNLLSDKFIKIFPAVCEWIEQQENDIISKGRQLTLNETEIAKRIGIKNYDVIKVIESDLVPQPKNKIILEMGLELGLLNKERTNGICYRYGIFINKNATNKNLILIHELIHTLQYEKFGSLEKFLYQYIKECIELGYESSPLELEAVNMSKLY